jgi:hypothetical protein
MMKTTAMNTTSTAYSDGVVSFDGIGKRIIPQAGIVTNHARTTWKWRIKFVIPRS